MRFHRPSSLWAIALASLLAACGDDAAPRGPSDASDARAPEPAGDTAEANDTAADSAAPDASPDAQDSIEDSAEDSADTALADVGPDASPQDTVNPQADAWQTTWARTVTSADARVLGMRYLGGQTAAGLVAVLELAGPAALDAGDGATEALAGEGHRLVVVSLDAASGAILAQTALALAEGEALAEVTKGPNGFAVAVTGAAPRVVLAQVFAGEPRVSEIAAMDEGGALPIGLPPAGDLSRASSGGATTALALVLGAGGTLEVRTGDATLSWPIAESGVGFLTLAAPSDATALPAEGSGLVVVPGLAARSVVETQFGPVLMTEVLAATTIRETELAAGATALVIGATPDAVASDTEPAPTDPSVPVVLWSSAAPSFEVVQIASGGGGLALAGLGEGELSFGADTLELASPQSFVATLGSDTGLLYTAPPCDAILGLSVGFQYRILERACDVDGQGPALVMTFIGSDISGVMGEPFDLVLQPLAGASEATLLSGLVSFSVLDGRAYGALFDLGEGPRLLLVRDDGQLYDSGVLPMLVASGPSAAPLLFQPMRQGGGGGTSNATTNAVIFAVPRDGGTLIGRARIDLKTLIW